MRFEKNTRRIGFFFSKKKWGKNLALAIVSWIEENSLARVERGEKKCKKNSRKIKQKRKTVFHELRKMSLAWAPFHPFIVDRKINFRLLRTADLHFEREMLAHTKVNDVTLTAKVTNHKGKSDNLTRFFSNIFFRVWVTAKWCFTLTSSRLSLKGLLDSSIIFHQLRQSRKVDFFPLSRKPQDTPIFCG